MPDGFYLISYVGGGTLGFLVCGLIFFPLEETIAFSLMLFSLIYLTGGTIGFLLWDMIE